MAVVKECNAVKERKLSRVFNSRSAGFGWWFDGLFVDATLVEEYVNLMVASLKRVTGIRVTRKALSLAGTLAREGL